MFGFEGAALEKECGETWPVGQVVKTAASHAVNIGSNPVRVTRFFLKNCIVGVD